MFLTCQHSPESHSLVLNSDMSGPLDIRKVFKGFGMVTNVRLASCFLQKIALLVTVKCSLDKSLEDEWPRVV